MKTQYRIVSKDPYGQLSPLFVTDKLYKTLRQAYDNKGRVSRIFNRVLHIQKVAVTQKCPYCNVEVHELKVERINGELVTE